MNSRHTLRAVVVASMIGAAPVAASAQSTGASSEASGPASSAAQSAPTEPQRSEADRRLELANRYSSRGNNEGALSEYNAVFRIFLSTNDARRFELLYTLGRTLQRMNRFDEAAEHYQRYLDDAPSDAPRRETCGQLVSYLRLQLGAVEVRSRVAGAVLWIQGRRVGPLPQLIRRPSGDVELEVRALDHGAVRQTVTVLSQRTTAVVLNPLPIRVRQGLPVAPFAVVAAATGAATVAWGVTAIAYAVERNRLVALDQAATRDLSVLPPLEQRCPPGETARQDCYVVRPAMGVWTEEQSAAQRIATGATVLLITSAVLAVGTTVLGFVTDFRSGGRLRPVVAVAPTSFGATLTVGGAL